MMLFAGLLALMATLITGCGTENTSSPSTATSGAASAAAPTYDYTVTLTRANVAGHDNPEITADPSILAVASSPARVRVITKDSGTDHPRSYTLELHPTGGGKFYEVPGVGQKTLNLPAGTYQFKVKRLTYKSKGTLTIAMG